VLGSSPYRTLNDLIAAVRAKPGELAFASGGPGSSLHIAIEVLKRAANLNITYVAAPRPRSTRSWAITAATRTRLDMTGHETLALCSRHRHI